MTYSITIDLSEAPSTELKAANPERIRSYAASVEQKGAYTAADVLRWLAKEAEKQKPPTVFFKPGDVVRIKGLTDEAPFFIGAEGYLHEGEYYEYGTRGGDDRLVDFNSEDYEKVDLSV